MDDRVMASIEEIAVEAWRFEGVFRRMLRKMDPLDASRYASQYAWFRKKVDEAVEKAGMHLVSVEGQPFDPGMAVTPLNIDEFGADEALIVQRMIEPIVMHEGKVCRTGVVMLRRDKP